MPYTETFLSTCRASINAQPEVATFRTAFAAFETASHNSKGAQWVAVYSDAQSGMSPAYQLRKVIRDTTTALAISTGGISPTEREEAIRTLCGQYVPDVTRPLTNEQEAAALQELLIQEQLS